MMMNATSPEAVATSRMKTCWCRDWPLVASEGQPAHRRRGRGGMMSWMVLDLMSTMWWTMRRRQAPLCGSPPPMFYRKKV